MQKEMKLKCRVADKDSTGRYQCIAKLFDGTEFTVSSFEYDLAIQGEFSEERSHEDGWLYVMQEAQQGERVAVTLPQPSDQHGRQVTVSQYDLMPRHASIEDFNPQKKTTKKK